jgi:hypothetical protein
LPDQDKTPSPELWVGLVEFKPLNKKNFGAAGVFTNLVTWTRNSAEFRKKAETIASTMGLYVAAIEDAEPWAQRIQRHSVSEELEDMVLRAETNPNAIIYGTFHRYPFDAS